MGLRVFDFRCAQGHVTEIFIDAECRVVECPQCGDLAHRQMSAPRPKLEGFSGAFPSAADAWERTRASKQAADERSVDRHGETRNGHKPGTFLGETFKATPNILK